MKFKMEIPMLYNLQVDVVLMLQRSKWTESIIN